MASQGHAPFSSDASRGFQVSSMFTSPASAVPPVVDRKMRQELLNNLRESGSHEAKLLAASKSHSEAEKRRRERINNHLSTLRGLLPSTAKTDKASLLAEVIHKIKELKKQVAEISELGPVPSDVDELNVDLDPSPSSDEEGKVLIRASICCDDRPNLLTDLVRTLKSLHLRTIKAEIATIEGRTKNVFVMTIKQEEKIESTLACVEGALRSVMEDSSEAPEKRPRSS